MTDQLKQIQKCLQNADSLLATKKVAAGFDGFIDAIVKVVNYKTDKGAVFFKTIAEFGNYITAKSGSGFSLESEELMQKLGGNMPIMANAMAQMGSKVNCVGAFGVPGIAPAFADMHPCCTLYSFTNPGFTNAIEFADGKIMLAQMTDLNKADWGTITSSIGLNMLKDIFTGTDLVCLVNWSELDHSNNIWQGLLNDIFSNNPYPPKQFFFDLSDCSKRSKDTILSAIKLLQQFSKYGHVTLSLNRNEANILYKYLINQAASDDLPTIGNQLYVDLGLNALIIHSSQTSLAWDANGIYSHQPAFISDPKISTGAGDNFNAGYCIAQMLGLNTLQSLILANTTANCYIKSGQSPDITTLSVYISELIVASL
ncbi:hypothetical protein FFF34_002350 [Inquilinus sp. KBS0705]|nr:hypothetical protein FFF34_002350 [Inquilinus sp. KBS0705]